MYTCTNDKYDNNPASTYESVEDFQAMCRACFGEETDLHTPDGGDTYTEGVGGEVVLRRVVWTATESDPDDNCGIEGAVSVTVEGGPYALAALVVRDRVNGGWSVYGDCPSLWLEDAHSYDFGRDTLSDIIDAATSHPELRAA